MGTNNLRFYLTAFALTSLVVSNTASAIDRGQPKVHRCTVTQLSLIVNDSAIPLNRVLENPQAILVKGPCLLNFAYESDRYLIGRKFDPATYWEHKQEHALRIPVLRDSRPARGAAFDQKSDIHHVELAISGIQFFDLPEGFSIHSVENVLINDADIGFDLLIAGNDGSPLYRLRVVSREIPLDTARSDFVTASRKNLKDFVARRERVGSRSVAQIESNIRGVCPKFDESYFEYEDVVKKIRSHKWILPANSYHLAVNFGAEKDGIISVVRTCTTAPHAEESIETITEGNLPGK